MELESLKGKEGKDFVKRYYSSDQDNIDLASDAYYNNIIAIDK